MRFTKSLRVAAAVGAVLGCVAPAANADLADVSSWGYTVTGSRYNANEQTVTPATVRSLRLKWAFAVPTATGQQSQPAVVNGTLYFGGTNGVFYALDSKTGKLRWQFDTNPIVGTSGQGNALRDGPAVDNGIVYFGDKHADIFALDATTGKMLWETKLSTHPAAVITGAPIVFHGRVIVGVSSIEELFAGKPTYACCTFRGSLAALDANTGRILWQTYTIPNPPAQTGVTSAGVPFYSPSGASVWTTPAIDPATSTVFVGTGNNYSGMSANEDAIQAYDVATGHLKWSTQLFNSDAWNLSCVLDPHFFNCPKPGTDFDFGSSPNVFTVGGHTYVGEGQKSGVYHVLDASNGKIVWQTLLNNVSGLPQTGGLEGIEWGTSYDGAHIYVATNIAKPGTLFALNPANGHIVWGTPVPLLTCLHRKLLTGLCLPALPSAVSSSPGLVWEGGQDGILRAYAAATGRVLWRYDTVRFYRHTSDGLVGFGGSIDGGGTTVADGMVYTDSGFTHFGIVGSEMTGNMVLAFAPTK
jgi:polyvinyl alcohol dehydrogenase (cytochrome)